MTILARTGRYSVASRPFGRSRVLLSCSEKLEVIGDDLELRPILATLFVLPRLKLQAPLNENAATFLKILGGVLGIAPPEGHLHEGHVLLLLPILILPDSIEGEAKLGDRVSGFCFPELGVASQIADKGNTIVTAHACS